MNVATEQTTSRQGIFLLIYGQVMALLGAFSLLVVLTHFFELGLRGVVQDAFEVWRNNIRPLFGHPLQGLVDLLPKTLQFAVPDLIKDYLAVGAVSAFSWARAMVVGGFRLRLSAIEWMSILLVAWPFGVGQMLYEWVGDIMSGQKEINYLPFMALFFAPLVYLGLLFAANAWLA
jgi:hypothetical protein